MLNIIGKKNWYFLISLLVIIPGIIALSLWGLNLSIDFTGGTNLTLLFPKPVTQQTVTNVQNVFVANKLEVVSIQPSGQRLIIRTKAINEKQDAAFLDSLKQHVGDVKQDEFFDYSNKERNSGVKLTLLYYAFRKK